MLYMDVGQNCSAVDEVEGVVDRPKAVGLMRRSLGTGLPASAGGLVESPPELLRSVTPLSRIYLIIGPSGRNILFNSYYIIITKQKFHLK
jgi:hypothetical protein